jgi:hypothetical protein
LFSLAASLINFSLSLSCPKEIVGISNRKNNKRCIILSLQVTAQAWRIAGYSISAGTVVDF